MSWKEFSFFFFFLFKGGNNSNFKISNIKLKFRVISLFKMAFSSIYVMTVPEKLNISAILFCLILCFNQCLSVNLCNFQNITLKTATFIELCFTLQLPVLGIPLRQIVVYLSLVPAFLQFYNNITIILHGGSGKNKSTIAVS